ncbi:MAG: VPLPA-CTERM sorting domain-containing protein [Pseudomonadales bacterium]|nr:VPLPA-CTERM sorting domain-containing protein [Pseudomonadales bacterium]
MKTKPPHPFTPRLLSLMVAVAFLPSVPAMAANCVWNPAAGNWATAGNWSCAQVPGSADSAGIAGGQTVMVNSAQSIFNLNNAGSLNIDIFLLTLNGGGATRNSGAINVGSGAIPFNAALQVGGGHNIDNSGGTINISADSVLNQFGSTISGGSINTFGSGKVVAFNSNSNALSAVTLNGNLDLASATGVERVFGGLTLNGVIDLNSNSVLSFGGDQTLGGTGSVVLGDSGSSNRALSLEGDTTLTIGSDMVVRGKHGTLGQAYLSGGSQKLVNDGRIAADVSGGILYLAPSHGTTNNGVIEAQNGGTLVLNSNVAGTTGSALNAGAGSLILQNGVTLSGVINTSGSGNLRASNSNSNALSAVTLNGNLDLASATGVERVFGGLTLNGVIDLNSNSVLSFGGDQTLGGTGSVVLGDSGSSNRALSLEGDTTLTIGSDMVVRGKHGTLGQAYLSGGSQKLVNDGRIAADVSGGILYLAPSHGTTNNGVIEAQNGGTLVLNSNVAGTTGSALNAGAGSLILQNGVTLSGVINTSGSGNLRASNSNSNALSAVTLNGNLDLASATGVERVFGGLTLNGVIDLNSNSVLSFGGDQTLGGTGSVVLGDSGSSNRALSLEGDTTLTIGSDMVVRGKHGTLGQAYLSGGSQKLVNDGRIAADVSGGILYLAPSHGTTNNGVIEAQNGGTLVLNSNVAGTTGSALNAGAGSLILQNGVTLSGVINTSGSGNLRASNSNSNALSAVTLNGNLDLASATGVERVFGGLTLNGVIDLNSNSVLSFGGDQTLGGTGSVVLGDSGSSNRALSLEGDTTLTIGSDMVVRGKHGTLGQAYLSGGSQKLVNDGRIAADVSGGILYLAPSHGTTNNGVISTVAGSTVSIGNSFLNAETGLITGNGTVVAPSGGLTNAGHVAPGASPGTLTIAGSYVQTTAGTLDIELADLSSFDLLKVTGNATLAGTLALHCFGACNFAVDDTLKILDAADNASSLTGSFDSLLLSGFGSGQFDVIYDRALGDVLLKVTQAVTPAPVPLPAASWLMLGGLGLLGGLRRVKRAG